MKTSVCFRCFGINYFAFVVVLELFIFSSFGGSHVTLTVDLVIMYVFRAVSYTHLDVYKRQGQDTSLGWKATEYLRRYCLVKLRVEFCR